MLWPQMSAVSRPRRSGLTDEDFKKLQNSIANSAGEAERINEIYRNTAQGALTELQSAFEGVTLNSSHL